MNLIPSSQFPIPINFYTEFFLRTHFTLLACSNMDISNLTISFNVLSSHEYFYILRYFSYRIFFVQTISPLTIIFLETFSHCTIFSMQILPISTIRLCFHSQYFTFFSQLFPFRLWISSPLVTVFPPYICCDHTSVDGISSLLILFPPPFTAFMPLSTLVSLRS